jgi:hypothetical protein
VAIGVIYIKEKMNMIETIKDLTYLQILEYYNFREIKRTTFVVVFLNDSSTVKYEYALFLNKEKNDELTLLDMFKRTLISKEDLLLKFTEDLKELLSNNDNQELGLTESITPSDLINYLYGFLPLDRSNKNLIESEHELLFSRQFNNISQDKDENLIIPLFSDHKLVNYYIENRTSIRTRFSDKKEGLYISKLTDSNLNIIVSFGLFNTLKFFSNNLMSVFLTIIPNPNISYDNTKAIVDYINKSGKNRFEKIIFLYNSSNIKELKSILDFFVQWVVCIKSQYKLFLDINYNENEAMQLRLIPPKDIEMTKLSEYFNDVNDELLNKFNISVNDENKKRFKKILFEIKHFNLEKNKSLLISFYPKVQTIELLLDKLNGTLFGEDTNLEFFDVKNIKIEEDEFEEEIVKNK